jgi:hypothetical protein
MSAQAPDQLMQDDRMAEYLIDSGIDAEVADSVTDLLDKEFALANIDRNDRRYARLMSENVILLLEEQYPPADSQLQDTKRAAYLGDASETKDCLGESTKTQLRTLLLAAFFRSSRSVDGWQQEKLSENIQTQRLEETRDGGDDGGLFGIFG